MCSLPPKSDGDRNGPHPAKAFLEAWRPANKINKKAKGLPGCGRELATFAVQPPVIASPRSMNPRVKLRGLRKFKGKDTASRMGNF